MESNSHPNPTSASSNDIGLLNEKPLHAALKEWCAEPGDQFEVNVDGYIIDIVRGNMLIEIQTANCSGIRSKLADLAERHPLRLVYPIAGEKWLLKLPKEEDGRPTRRKSPKRGVAEELFKELVSFPQLMCNPNFSLQVVLIQEEEVRRYDGKRRWRRQGWVTEERRLLKVIESNLYNTPADLIAMIPAELPDPFTTADLARSMQIPRWLAQKAAYCLRQMGSITHVGHKSRSYLYTLNSVAGEKNEVAGSSGDVRTTSGRGA